MVLTSGSQWGLRSRRGYLEIGGTFLSIIQMGGGGYWHRVDTKPDTAGVCGAPGCPWTSRWMPRADTNLNLLLSKS